MGTEPPSSAEKVPRLNKTEYCYIDAIRKTCMKPVPSLNSWWYNGHKRAICNSFGSCWFRGSDMEKEFVEAIERAITHLVTDFKVRLLDSGMKETCTGTSFIT